MAAEAPDSAWAAALAAGLCRVSAFNFSRPETPQLDRLCLGLPNGRQAVFHPYLRQLRLQARADLRVVPDLGGGGYLPPVCLRLPAKGARPVAAQAIGS